ncbi:hypothetical protein [Spongiimicrobium sp. 2-473A-2-J]|uniref:hypothetical protein n=1 Tax=Eudoraea algarum TaxID=3417568 RepID=UPI003D36BEE6
MARHFILWSVCLYSLIGYAQVRETNPFTTTADDLGFFGEAIEKVYLFDALQEYSLSEKFRVQLQGIYVRELEGGTYHFPLMGKYYLSEKVYVLGGPTLDFFRTAGTGEMRPTGFGTAAGAGYDVNKNFFIQAQGDFKVKRFNTEFDKAPRPNSMLTITSGFKF